MLGSSARENPILRVLRVLEGEIPGERKRSKLSKFQVDVIRRAPSTHGLDLRASDTVLYYFQVGG